MDINSYRKALGDLIEGYEASSIYHSELYSFWEMCKKHNINHIVESGTHYGFSTLRLQKLFPDIRIETYEKDRTFYEAARKRLKVECYCEDIRDVVLDLTPRTAVLIDGPKKERAIKLAETMVDSVAFVAMHDMKKYLKKLKFKEVHHTGNPSEEIKALDAAIPYNPKHHKHGLYGNVLAIVRNR